MVIGLPARWNTTGITISSGNVHQRSTLGKLLHLGTTTGRSMESMSEFLRLMSRWVADKSVEPPDLDSRLIRTNWWDKELHDIGRGVRRWTNYVGNEWPGAFRIKGAPKFVDNHWVLLTSAQRGIGRHALYHYLTSSVSPRNSSNFWSHPSSYWTQILSHRLNCNIWRIRIWAVSRYVSCQRFWTLSRSLGS